MIIIEGSTPLCYPQVMRHIRMHTGHCSNNPHEEGEVDLDSMDPSRHMKSGRAHEDSTVAHKHVRGLACEHIL